MTNDMEILDQYIIPLPDLRMMVVELMKEGDKEIPLGQLIVMLKNIAEKRDVEE